MEYETAKCVFACVRACVCVCVCVCKGEGDLSSGITLTGEKVKLADPHRQVDNLFGQKMHEKMERSLHSIVSKKARNPIRETETDREKESSGFGVSAAPH